MISATRASSRGALPPTPSNTKAPRPSSPSLSPKSAPHFIEWPPSSCDPVEQRLFELLARPQQARPDRRARNREPRRDLVIATAIDEPELVDLAKGALEARQRCPHLLAAARLPL